MATFVHNEAQLDENASDSDDFSSGEPVAKKAKKQKKHRQISSDEEDDEDEPEDDDKVREEMRGFVVDEDEEGVEEDDGEDDDYKSDKAPSDASDDLLEDDLELLNENFGRTTGGRVEISDDEDDRERIKGNLFGNDDEAEEVRDRDDLNTFDDSRSDSEQSEDPFIVQDDEMGRRRRPKGHRSTFSDQVLDEAKDIFGVEDLNDFYEDEEALEDEGEEGEEGVPIRHRGLKVSLLSATEPSELAKGFVSAEDRKIISEDRPERFQTRRIPVMEIDENDLAPEAAWVHEYAFRTSTISKQGPNGLTLSLRGGEEAVTAEKDAPDKIREAIRFIRNQLFEVPFIAFYRKEYVDSSLVVDDLWKVYLFDQKWCHLQQRKSKLTDLLRRVESYIHTSEVPGAANLRRVSEKDFNNINGVQTVEELSDIYSLFQLYYGNELSRIQEWEQQTAQDNLEMVYAPKFKLSSRADKYQLCVQCGLAPVTQQFGLTSEQFAVNFTEYSTKHPLIQSNIAPNDFARNFVSETFPTEEKVLEGAIYMLAQQISREPALRRKLRLAFRNRLKFSAYPTKKGRNEIDESHPLWNKNYVQDKPAEKLAGDEYLHYFKAKKDGLIEIELYCDASNEHPTNTLLAYLSKDQIFYIDQFFYVVEEWNKARNEVLRVCVEEILLPTFKKEAHEKLMEEARDFVIKQAAAGLSDIIKYESFKPTLRHSCEDDDDIGFRILSICYSSDSSEASFAVVIDQDGVVVESLRMVNFLKRSNSIHISDATLKSADLEKLKLLVLRRLPHVICINGENLDALRLRNELLQIIKVEADAGRIFNIPVEILNNDVATVYRNSQMSLQEFPEFPPLLREAVSLARFMLDPLVEICHLCNIEDDILFLRLHPLQNEVSHTDLLSALHIEIINRVNEVGVDINRCLEFPHTAGLLQFVCGLGPRKASHLLKILKQNDNLLESRTKLVTFCRMGPKVFMNAAGFIKIDTTKVSEKTDSYVELLDGSRVHPETYEWARKMAVDALEIDDPADPTAALEEILQAPERLKDLDLDAFAEELARQGFGNKSVTLYDIRAELNYRYKDLRAQRVSLEGDELFNVLVKDNKSFSPGKLVLGTVQRVLYRRVTDEDKKRFRQTVNNETNLWECYYCKRDDFLSQPLVLEHANIGTDCPGVPVGMRIHLEGALYGFVPNKSISENFENYRNPLKLLKPGNQHYFRVVKINPDRMECELSCRTRDLQNYGEKDSYFNEQRFLDEKAADSKAKRIQMDRVCIQKRVISHPSFYNVTFKEAERMLSNNLMDQGDCVIHPSTKSNDQLTVSWKVSDGIFQHFPLVEKEKKSQFEIGKKLYIMDEEFEDLDEIIARYVQPMAAYARDIMSYKHFKRIDPDLASDPEKSEAEIIQKLEQHLRAEKRQSPSKIPYVLSASKKLPGKFRISYLPSESKNKIMHEDMRATPAGIRFRGQMFRSIDILVNWFKRHFADPPPGAVRR